MSCEDLYAHRTLVRPNTPMGRVDIAPTKGLPQNPYAIVSPGTRGHPLTPADRYDVFPSPEDPYCRRYTRSPHPSRGRPVGEEGLTPSTGRQPQTRVSRWCSDSHRGLGFGAGPCFTPALVLFPRFQTVGTSHPPPDQLVLWSCLGFMADW